MNSRERVRKALNFQEPDRLPIDIGGSVETTITVDAYCDLARYLNVDVSYPKVYDQFVMVPTIEGHMLDWFHTDVIQLENHIMRWGLRNSDWKLWETGKGNKVLMPGNFNPEQDEKGYYYIKNSQGKILAYMAPGSLYFDRYGVNDFKGEVFFMDPDEWKKAIPVYSDEELKILEKRAKFLYENTEYSIFGAFAKGSLFSNEIWAGNSISDWLCAHLTEPDQVKAITQVTTERALENLELYMQAVGKYIDTVVISASDFGTQRGELFDPQIFKDIYMPNYKKINDYVHAHSNAKTFYHCCGSIVNLIESFIECGIDALNPVQTSAKNMDPRMLKEKFGGRIIFWGGGADTQSVLPFGTPEEVREDVRKRIEIFAPGGGFIFNAIHNIQYGVSPQNIEAMIKAALDFGKYPIACGK